MDKNYISILLQRLRTQAPLVHNITNYVVMNNTANALLSLGASPVMAHAQEEVEDITTISSALVLNIGTLSEKWIDSMLMAGKKAKELNKPITFDPVGAGASAFRTNTCKTIIEECCPNIIRGNASEIMALCDSSIKTKGVDSTQQSNEALANAQVLAQKLKNTIVISGATDYIVTENSVIEITNGSPLMPKITGMGCTATALVGAFTAVEDDMAKAAAAGMAVMSVAGEMAVQYAKAPGCFQVHFLDALYQIKGSDIEDKLNMIVYEY